MFRWEQQRQSLQTTASRILRIERSIADVQVSLPGLSPEDASAYLCAYRDDKGIRIAVVLHLLQSDRLAFYMNDDGPLDSEAAGRVLGEGLFFAESLGFSLGDLDVRRLPREQQAELLTSLAFFLSDDQPRKVKPPAAPRPAAKAVEQAVEPAAAATTVVSPEPEPPPQPDPQIIERRPPTAAELQQRRLAFVQSLGRLLGML